VQRSALLGRQTASPHLGEDEMLSSLETIMNALSAFLRIVKEDVPTKGTCGYYKEGMSLKYLLHTVLSENQCYFLV
jgi:hypothetical protein